MAELLFHLCLSERGRQLPLKAAAPIRFFKPKIEDTAPIRLRTVSEYKPRKRIIAGKQALFTLR